MHKVEEKSTTLGRRKLRTAVSSLSPSERDRSLVRGNVNS